MKMLEIAALPNGAHRNQTYHGTLLAGWAVIPDDLVLPETFPFVEVEVKDVAYSREVEVLRDVVKQREVVTIDETGEEVTTLEEYTEQELVTEVEYYDLPTVVSMTEGIVPEPVQEPETPTQLDRVEAQVTYTAMMTDTLLEV